MAFQSITESCHQRLVQNLRPGDWALDATAGNGYDSVCLAKAVGPNGRVWAVDRQAIALNATRARLEDAGLCDRVALVCGDHAELLRLLPAATQGRLRAIVFNLGYLPGGDKTVTTQATSTLIALAAATAMLAPEGMLAIVCYPGHECGAQEAVAVERWAEETAHSRAFALETVHPGPTLRPAPFLLCLKAPA